MESRAQATSIDEILSGKWQPNIHQDLTIPKEHAGYALFKQAGSKKKATKRSQVAGDCYHRGGRLSAKNSIALDSSTNVRLRITY